MKKPKDLTDEQLVTEAMEICAMDMHNSDSPFADDAVELRAELLRRLASAPAPLDVEKVAKEIAEFTEKKFEEAMEEAVYDVKASDFETILRKHLPSPEGKE